MSATETTAAPAASTPEIREDALRSALATAPRPPRQSAVGSILTFGWRGMLKIKHVPEQLIDVTITPVLFTVMFTYMFGGAIAGSTSDYLQFLLPGTLVMSVVFTTVYSGVALNTDMTKGVVDRFRSLPIARSAVLFGRTAADVVMNVMTLIVMLLVGFAVGFRPGEPVWSIALALLLVLGFAYTFSWISAFIGLAVKDPETAQSAGMLWVFPLTFASSAFVPTDSMPGVVQAFADVNPVSLAVDAARALMIGEGDALGPALGTLAWIAGLLAVFIPLAVRAFRKA